MKKKLIILFALLFVLPIGLLACAHQHELVKIERVEATCTTDGNVGYWECSACKKKFTDNTGSQEITDTVIHAGHKLSEVTAVEATCTSDGNVGYWECSACKKKFTDNTGSQEITDTVIHAGHKLSEVTAVEATCTSDGNVGYWECSTCKKKFTDDTGSQEITDTVIRAGHKLSEVTAVEATCTSDGNVGYWECSACKKKFTDNTGSQEITDTVIHAGHKLSEVTAVEATCTSDGNVGYWECSACKKKFTDDTGSQEITDTVIRARHKYGEYEYNYETKSYVKSCSVCKDVQSIAAGGKDYPILARNETELAEVISTADEQSFVKLANDITITTGMYAVVLRLPDSSTLDLGGHTVTVKNNGGFVVEGTNVTLQNGNVVTDYKAPKSGYAVFIGDEGANNSVTVKNLNTQGGLNVYNCEATLYDCNVDASAHTYYALWADAHSTVTVESGVYRGGETACIHSTVNADPEGTGYIVLNGGEFYGKVIATYCTAINGGSFDSDIVLTFYQNIHAKLVVNKNINSSLNIVVGDTVKYDVVCNIDDDGNFVYETVLKDQQTVQSDMDLSVAISDFGATVDCQ